MNQYTLIAGVNGTGSSSFRGVLEGQGVRLGRIIDPDLIAWKDGTSIADVKRRLLKEIAQCLRLNAPFTQESIAHIENRVRKGGYGIPGGYVTRCFSRRWDVLNRAFTYCDKVIFYDNENGFVKIAEYKNSRLTLFAPPPPWAGFGNFWKPPLCKRREQGGMLQW